jgi:ornithine carbamoyltransferase
MDIPKPPLDAGAVAPDVALPLPDSAVVLAYARMLQREALKGRRQLRLRGKNIGVIGDRDGDPAARRFSEAAEELGATVAQLRPFASGATAPTDLQRTARLLGRLYDAIEWPAVPTGVLQHVQAAAGIPVFDGLAAPSHPTARLADLLGGEASMTDRRRFVLQAVLLAAII